MRVIEEVGHTRGNRGMSRSARQRVNRNARRLVTYIVKHESDLRRRIHHLGCGLDAATLRGWISARPSASQKIGIASVVGDGDGDVIEVNWEYAAELVNRKMYV